MAGNDLSGEVFGKLTAVDRWPNEADPYRVYWRCVCSCAGPNAIRVVRADNLVGKRTKSCVDCGRAGRPKGSQNSPIAPRYVAQVFTAPAHAMGTFWSFAIVSTFDNRAPLLVLETKQRAKSIRGYPPGAIPILKAMVDAGAIEAQKDGQQMAAWIKRQGVIFERVNLPNDEAVNVRHAEATQMLGQPRTLPALLDDFEPFQGEEQ